MKRGLAALVIFIFCIDFSVFCTVKTRTALKNTGVILEEIKSCCINNECEKAADGSLRLKEEWENSRLIIETTVDRSAVKVIEDAVISLPVLLSDGKTDEAYSLCSEALGETVYLLEKERISFENVF